MRPVSPLKVTYQRNLLRGMIISASLMLLPMTIWYYYQDDEMVAINVGDVRQVNVDTQQPKPVNGKTGSGQRGEVGKGLKGRQVDFDHNMRGYGIVQESLPVVTPIDFVHKTTPIGWVDDDFIDAQGPDMVIPEGDGWPIAAEGPIFKKLGKSAREFSFNFEKRTINKPGPNSPTIIRLGAERWPEGPKVQGINNGVVKIILYLDNKGNYLKNGK
ncbi:MAG: hypothetical protein NTV06_04105, partial [candidate division Zixibacteria bacterium]|nr:hypothetical protein [candidate division Zixibacteria bacterium]